MNVRTITVLLVFTLVISQQVVSIGQPPKRGKMLNLAPSATVSSPLGIEIQRYLAQLRHASLARAFRHAPPPAWFDSRDEMDRWFDAWDDTDPRFDGWDDTGPRPDSEAQKPLADCPGGLAISLAEVDGHFEIEAGLANQQGQQKFRASGSREEIDAWVLDLPPRLREAIQRHLAELDGAAEQPSDDPLEEPQPKPAPQT